jgi:hypothetical protein
MLWFDILRKRGSGTDEHYEPLVFMATNVFESNSSSIRGEINVTDMLTENPVAIGSMFADKQEVVFKHFNPSWVLKSGEFVYQSDFRRALFNGKTLPIKVRKSDIPIVLYDKEQESIAIAECLSSASLSREMLNIYTAASVFAYAAAKMAYKKRRLHRTYWRRFGTVADIPEDITIAEGWEVQKICEDEGILDRKNTLFVKAENAELTVYGASSASLGAEAYKLEKRW